VCNDRFWCAVKFTLRYRPACTGCRKHLGSEEGNLVGIERFCVFCRGEKWSGYCSGLNWLTLEAEEMLGKCGGGGGGGGGKGGVAGRG